MPQSRGSITGRRAEVAEFSHGAGSPVSGTTPPGTAAAPDRSAPPAAAPGGRRASSLSVALVSMAAVAVILLVLFLLPAARSDPYTRATLRLEGSEGTGGSLFRLNCAGCHGLSAQGLVGPDLHGVAQRRSDRQLIRQVVSGRTPPMPRFQPDPQAMADLLAFLHSLP